MAKMKNVNPILFHQAFIKCMTAEVWFYKIK